MYVPWDCNRVESLTRSSCPPWYGIITQPWETSITLQPDFSIHCFLLIQNEVESRMLSVSCYTRNQHTWCTKRRKFYYKQLKSSDRSTEQKLTMSKSVKKLVEETKEQGYTELELCDKSLSSIADIPGLSKCTGHSWKQKKLEERIHVLFESNFVMFRPYIFAYFSYKLSFSPAEAFGTAYVKSQQNNVWVNFF